MRFMSNILRGLASIGLNNASAIDPSGTNRVPQPQPPEPTPPGKLRLHLFGATFADQGVADRFCYEVPQPDYPEPLTRELDGAFINTEQVEVVCGPVLPRLQEFLSAGEADDIMLRLGADNSLIIITELAFGGMPYTLDDTDTLTYLGAIMVDV